MSCHHQKPCPGRYERFQRAPQDLGQESHPGAGGPGPLPVGRRKGIGQGCPGEAHSLVGGPEAGTRGTCAPPIPVGKAACWAETKSGKRAEGQAEGTQWERSLEGGRPEADVSRRPGSERPGHWEWRVRVGRGGWGQGASLRGAGSVASRPQAPALPPSVPLSCAGTLNEHSSCLLLGLLAAKKGTGMSQTEEIRCHPGLGSGCAVKEKGLELRIGKSMLSAKGEQLVSAATFQVGTGAARQTPLP